MLAPAGHLRSIIDHDGAVILDFERDAMLTLNSTGGYVWEKLRQGRLIDEIVSELASETGADLATVDCDVHAFVDELKSKHCFVALAKVNPGPRMIPRSNKTNIGSFWYGPDPTRYGQSAIEILCACRALR